MSLPNTSNSKGGWKISSLFPVATPSADNRGAIAMEETQELMDLGWQLEVSAYVPVFSKSRLSPLSIWRRTWLCKFTLRYKWLATDAAWEEILQTEDTREQKGGAEHWALGERIGGTPMGNFIQKRKLAEENTRCASVTVLQISVSFLRFFLFCDFKDQCGYGSNMSIKSVSTFSTRSE